MTVVVCVDGVVKWYAIVHFDPPERLKAWVEAGDREQMLQLGQAIFTGSDRTDHEGFTLLTLE